MELVKLSTLHYGDVFLTKNSKLLIYQFKDGDEIIASRYSDEYYTEVLKGNSMVFKMENL